MVSRTENSFTKMIPESNGGRTRTFPDSQGIFHCWAMTLSTLPRLFSGFVPSRAATVVMEDSVGALRRFIVDSRRLEQSNFLN